MPIPRVMHGDCLRRFRSRGDRLGPFGDRKRRRQCTALAAYLDIATMSPVTQRATTKNTLHLDTPPKTFSPLHHISHTHLLATTAKKFSSNPRQRRKSP